jgi:hypothetical protein
VSESRWVEIPIEPWIDHVEGVEDHIYLAFEPLLPQDNEDRCLTGIRAWVRLVVVDVRREGRHDRTGYHVNVGTDLRKLLNARLQGFRGEDSGIYYVEGRAEMLEGPPTDLPALPKELIVALQRQWLQDYREELPD